jgi:hypothetical protein
MNELPASQDTRRAGPRLSLALAGILLTASLGMALSVTPAFADDTLTVSSTTLSFPATPAGDLSSTLAVTITNGTPSPVTAGVGGGALAAGTDFVYDGEDCPTTQAPGSSCSASYQFAPKSAAALSDTASLTVQGSPVTIHLHGKGVPDFSVSPTTLVFPDTVVGASTPMQSVVLTNISASAHTPSLAGGALIHRVDFVGDGQTCGSVPPGGTCAFRYHFKPTTVGDLTDTTTIGVDGANYPITVSGKGITGIDVTPTALSFPDTAVGTQSSPLEVTLTNITTQVLHPGIGGGALTTGTNFIYNGENCPDTLAPGAACQASYSFAPTSDDKHTDTATLMVSGTTVTISLTGGHAVTTTTTTPTIHSTPTTTHPSTHTHHPTATAAPHTSTIAPAPTGPALPVTADTGATGSPSPAVDDSVAASTAGAASAVRAAAENSPESAVAGAAAAADRGVTTAASTGSPNRWWILWIVLAVLLAAGVGVGAFLFGRSRRG